MHKPFRYVLVAACLTATPVWAGAPQPAPGKTVTANMGAVTGSGTLTDRDGQPIGTWSVTAVLKAGKFAGSSTVVIKGQTVSLPLIENRSYLENSRCVFYSEQDRTHIELSGPCTSNGIGGFLNAFIPAGEVYSVSGYVSGGLAFRAAGVAPKTGVLPTARLICAWMERMGGVVAGQDYHYELRYSNMGYLQLSPQGTYKTANTSGKWVRSGGDSIRLISGQFAGAVGHLQPDKSGQPAIYFERDENRDARDVHIVDPQRTSCTVKR
jgi:hypothetical protein